MKKCPYCAEEIQDEAILCRYCGREFARLPEIPLPAIPIPANSSPVTISTETPSSGTPLWSIQTPARPDQSNTRHTKPSTANPVGAGITIGLIIASLVTLRHFVAGMAFLSQIPGAEMPARVIPNLFGSLVSGLLIEFVSALLIYSLIGWLVAGILHQVNKKFSTKALTLLGLLIIVVVVYIIAFAVEASNSNQNTSNPPASSLVVLATQPRIIPTPSRMPTARPTFTPRPRPSATPDCFQPDQLTASMVNRDVCVYGELQIMQFMDVGSRVFIQGQNGVMVFFSRLPHLLPGLDGATCGKYYGPLVKNEYGQFEIVRVTGMQYCDAP